ncbi:MAG TPA: hypothetical protein VNH83_14945 [Bryobacteraceae bacterium]|nr:hypothetical protein [Bryobacteraceae bacterium]
MFTVKAYRGSRITIHAAESFTILRDDGGAEITVHMKDARDDFRLDVVDPDLKRGDGWPPVCDKVIIENAFGRTTEIIALPGPQTFQPRDLPAEKAA